MPASNEHRSSGVVDADAITEDMSCLNCAYNLRGLDRRTSCPECGLSIRNTVVARQGITKRELAALAYRVSAVCFLFALLKEYLQFGQFGFFAWTLIVPSVPIITLIGLVWWRADWLARISVRSDGPTLITGRVIAHQFMSVALGIIGVLYLIQGFTQVIWVLWSIVSDQDQDYLGVSIFGVVIYLLIGWGLLLGGTRIAKSIVWLRTAGIRKRDLN